MPSFHCWCFSGHQGRTSWRHSRKDERQNDDVAPKLIHTLPPRKTLICHQVDLVMANSVALVVQAELLPAQSTASLSPFPSLLGSGEDVEDDRERGELVEVEKGGVEGGEEVVLGMVSSSVSGPAPQPEQSDHPFQCLDCGKSFRWSSRLTHHLRSHNNERPYRCNLCPKAFKGSSALLYHQRYPH